jgi:short-chain Z-isoprenyl diphosphate synthase
MPLARGSSTMCWNGAVSCAFRRSRFGRSQPIISAGARQPRCPASLPRLRPAALAQDSRIHQQRVRVKTAGRLEMLPISTVAVIRAAEEATASYRDGLTVTIAVAYGGHDEITDAVRALLREAMTEGKALAETVEAVTPAAIARHLYMAGLPDPDLIIRTSGENRLSGFLLWQSAYSELYFTDVNWPAFRKIDFLRAVRAFQQRKRRFGG